MTDATPVGPFVREIRCDATVLRYLTLKLPVAKPREPYEPQPWWGVPIIEDGDVPACCIRRVYGDGTVEDIVVMGDATYEVVRDMPKMLEFKPPPAPNRFSDLYAYGLIAQQSTTFSLIWGIHA